MSYRDHRSWLRCNECRTRRSTFELLLKHQKTSKDCRPCTCGGYHFAHRPGSPYCYQNPHSYLRHALRRCETDEEIQDVLMDDAWNGPGTVGDECPF